MLGGEHSNGRVHPSIHSLIPPFVALLRFLHIHCQTAHQIDLKLGSWIHCGTPQAWVSFDHASLNLHKNLSPLKFNTKWGPCINWCLFILKLTRWGWDKMAAIFSDNIFKLCIFLNENVWISIAVSLKFLRNGPFNNIPALVQIMAWCRPGDKPLSEPMMA